MHVKTWRFLNAIEIMWRMQSCGVRDDALQAQLLDIIAENYPAFRKDRARLNFFRRRAGMAYRMYRRKCKRPKGARR